MSSNKSLPTPFGCMPTLINNKYRLKEKLGSGSYGICSPPFDDKANKIQGEVFRARNVLTNEEFAIKLSPANDTASVLCNEYDVLCRLQGVTGIPRAVLFESDSSYNAIILECLGPSFEEVFESSHRSFSRHTISMIGEQLVR